MSDDRKFDVVIWGASGYTGALTAHYFGRNYTPQEAKGAPRWAIAGRSKAKLEQVKEELVKKNDACKRIPILIGDASDQASVDDIVRQTKVIISTAGPFIKYGEAVVSACARLGTCYGDITGEALWVKQMIDKYDETAKASGALIVSMCGFDSIPSDMGAFFVAEHIKHKLKKDVRRIHGYHKLKGAASGGTIATMMEIMSLPTEELKKAGNPYLLNDAGRTPQRGDADFDHDKDVKFMSYSDEVNAWTVPFVMAGVNTRVARRSLSTLNYGKKCTYNETMKIGGFCPALMTMMGLALFLLLMVFRCGQSILKLFLPAPGQGPSEKDLQEGWFKVDMIGTAEDGTVVKGLIKGGEPGYWATSGMLAEAGLCMALNRDECKMKGFQTTAVGLGHCLIRRLPTAGVTFTIMDTEKK